MPRRDGCYRFGPFHLDIGEHRLVRNGVDVPLQLKSFEILRLLVAHAGRLISKEELLRQVWAGTVVEENNLNKNISLLRKILGEQAGGRSYIETVPRVGYRFNAEVVEVVADVSLVPGKREAEAGDSELSIAVLYFENLSGDKDDEYFRDGMTEDVITELAKISGLRVFPRSTVLPYRDSPLPATQVGHALSSAFVLEGSVRRAGAFLRITARLADARTGHSVWAERYDRRLEDVFTIQDEIAQNIARALRLVLTENERRAIEKIPTSDIQAYDYYLRGRQYFYQMRRQSLGFARQMFARAMFIDPEYARAHAGVADCCSFLYMWCEAGEANLLEALAASRRAVNLDPQSAEAHASLGFAEFLAKNYEAARVQFETALELDSGLFQAYYFYGRSCFAQGLYEKAASLFASASKTNPQDYQSLSLLGLSLRALERMDEARETYRACLAKIEQHLQLNPDDIRAISLGAGALYALGNHAAALEWTNRSLGMDPEQAPILYNAACTYALLGENDKALDCLDRAFRQGFGHFEWIEHDPELSSLRNDPRLKALLRGIQNNQLSWQG